MDSLSESREVSLPGALVPSERVSSRPAWLASCKPVTSSPVKLPGTFLNRDFKSLANRVTHTGNGGEV